jgi:hypothetical protein
VGGGANAVEELGRKVASREREGEERRQRILCSKPYSAHMHIYNLSQSFQIRRLLVFLRFSPPTSPPAALTFLHETPSHLDPDPLCSERYTLKTLHVCYGFVQESIDDAFFVLGKIRPTAWCMRFSCSPSWAQTAKRSSARPGPCLCWCLCFDSAGPARSRTPAQRRRRRRCASSASILIGGGGMDWEEGTTWPGRRGR